MPVNQENINRWIEQAEIDYIGHFIKAWIPFNAWYNNHYPTLNTDREKISTIKSQGNSVRNGINAYMESDSQQGLEFRSYISALYYQLQQNQIDGRDGRIWFDTALKEKNPVNEINNREIGHNRYYLIRTDGVYMGEITEMKVILKKKSDGSTIYSYTHTEYDLAHLQSQANFQALSSGRQEQIRLLFLELEPIKIDTVLETDKVETPRNYYQCDSYSLRRDTSNPNCYSIHVCKALIEILYQLRNVLFHGELVPNNGAQKVYKEAYHILNLILEKIK